jgi:hypothetical protein
MRLRALLGIGLLAMGTAAIAQDHPVNSPAYHAVHHPQSPAYTSPRQQSEQQQPPQPTGYWEKTWGAIAPSPVGGVLGTALGASSKEEAERLALEDCKAKGGEACKVDVAYYNQCAAMVLGEKTYSWARAASVAEATEIGMADCKKGNSDCRVYYSACTEPVFHRY